MTITMLLVNTLEAAEAAAAYCVFAAPRCLNSRPPSAI